MTASLTHLALHVADAEIPAAFYPRFAAVHVVRAWQNQGGGLKVKCLKSAAASNPFVLVLLEGRLQFLDDRPEATIGPLSHFGSGLDSREEIDYVAVEGEATGALLGEHTDELLGWLGYSAAEIADMHKEGAV